MIYLGADHGGFEIKEKIKVYLQEQGHNTKDVGATTIIPEDDYPDYAKKVCKNVLRKKRSLGILICGSGTGMAIAANRNKGIRAAVAYDEYSAKMARLDNNANILCLRGRKTSWRKTKRIIQTFTNTHFSGANRHERRIKKIEL
jgi:RpiB/LacA/LacB family sugar-phosphate isomerase